MSTTSTLPCIIDSFEYRLALASEEDDVVNVLAGAFVSEPCIKYCTMGEEVTKEHLAEFSKLWVSDAISEGQLRF